MQKLARIRLCQSHQAGLALQVRYPEPGQARLCRSDQVTRTAHRQIFFGDLESIFGVADRGQASRAGLTQGSLVEEETGRGRLTPPDPSAQLVKLCQAETFRLLDHHDRCIRDVHPDLDHRGRHQNRRLSGHEPRHGRVLVGEGHLAVHQTHTFTQSCAQGPETFFGAGVVGIDPDEIHLFQIDTFHTETVLAAGLRELFKQLEERLAPIRPIKVFLAGGMAVHLYTANRITTDVDAEFGSRIAIPDDLLVSVMLENGNQEFVYFDTNYNSSFALMHEDHQDDAIFLDIGTELFSLHVLSPLDLAVSKIARFSENDKADISALIRAGLTNANEIEERASSALDGYVGGIAMLKLKIRDAVALARKVESE